MSEDTAEEMRAAVDNVEQSCFPAYRYECRFCGIERDLTALIDGRPQPHKPGCSVAVMKCAALAYAVVLEARGQVSDDDALREAKALLCDLRLAVEKLESGDAWGIQDQHTAHPIITCAGHSAMDVLGATNTVLSELERQQSD